MSDFVLGPKQKLWIAALRSGLYKQGMFRLYRPIDETYCCLGVANSVCKLNEVAAHSLVNTYEDIGLRDNFGMFKHTYTFPNGLEVDNLTSMNDSMGLTFIKIADFIEKNPELVFTHSV